MLTTQQPSHQARWKRTRRHSWSDPRQLVCFPRARISETSHSTWQASPIQTQPHLPQCSSLTTKNGSSLSHRPLVTNKFNNNMEQRLALFQATRVTSIKRTTTWRCLHPLHSIYRPWIIWTRLLKGSQCQHYLRQAAQWSQRAHPSSPWRRYRSRAGQSVLWNLGLLRLLTVTISRRGAEDQWLH